MQDPALWERNKNALKALLGQLVEQSGYLWRLVQKRFKHRATGGAIAAAARAVFYTLFPGARLAKMTFWVL